MDESFLRSYACELLHESPTTRWPHFYYPGASTQGGKDGFLLAVRPDGGEPWIGTFAFGDRRGFSGIFAMPQPRKLCVVARGWGCIVDAHEPTLWDEVKAWPITDVRPVPSHGILVFADSTELTAYGPSGLAWRTRRLSWSDLRINDVDATTLAGEFTDLDDTVRKFRVDLATGAAEGGIG